MDAFLDKAKDIHTIEEAEAFLWEEIPDPLDSTKEALQLSIKAHKTQKRKSGEPYVVHPILVAAITAHFSNDETMVQAALLHDVVEDTAFTIEELEVCFGEDVTHMVEGLTKIVQIRDKKLVDSSSDKRLISSALTFRKMLIASIKDIRVLVIKLCDRMHNMLTLDALNEEKRKRIAEETLVVYAPIAHRLGISKLKNHLEDLSFFYIYPHEYRMIDEYIHQNAQNLQFKLNLFISEMKALMEKHGFLEQDFELFGRVKHYYSIYLKMQRKGISIEEVLDLLAIRIVLKKSIDTYKVLGLIHLTFTPLMSRFKDYIAVPKENGYRTIHTTLFHKESIVEAQIRTLDMHHLAEYGVAAHWKYKKGGNNSVNLEWLESLNYQNESVEEFYELAKGELFSEDIAVYSPLGKVYTLPKGSVALDFAYLIHSEVGAYAVHALINKHKVSLLSVLKNGDIVNIVKDDIPHFHCSWVDAVKTSKARTSIRSACKARIKEIDRLSAYNILSTLFGQTHQEIQEIVSVIDMEESIHKLPSNPVYYKEVIHKLATVTGRRELRFWNLLQKGYKKPKVKTLDHFHFFTNRPLEGVEFDYCCHPKMGDQIVAFYKDSKAIIHHKLCKQSYKQIVDSLPMLHVEWVNDTPSRYRLTISLQNQKGILADLLKWLYRLDMNVTGIELGIQSSESAEYCQIEVESRESKKSVVANRVSQKFKLIEIINLDDAYNK